MRGEGPGPARVRALLSDPVKDGRCLLLIVRSKQEAIVVEDVRKLDVDAGVADAAQDSGCASGPIV